MTQLCRGSTGAYNSNPRRSGIIKFDPPAHLEAFSFNYYPTAQLTFYVQYPYGIQSELAGRYMSLAIRI